MNKISETLGYARGLLKAMEGGEYDANLLELLGALLNAADAQGQAISKMDEQLNELDEYVESIDDDFTELEYSIDEMLHHDADGDEFAFDDENDEHPLHLVKGRHECKCGHHHDEDHECHCHEEGHTCHCHDDDCDCDDEELDDDEEMDLSSFDNLFLGVLCPECGHMFCVTDEDFDAPGVMYTCPFCKKDVHVSPIDPANVPVAKRVK